MDFTHGQFNFAESSENGNTVSILTEKVSQALHLIFPSMWWILQKN